MLAKLLLIDIKVIKSKTALVIHTLTFTLQASQKRTIIKTAKGKIIISNFIKYVKNIQ